MRLSYLVNEDIPLKFVGVAFVYDYGFAPVIELTGAKNDYFKESEWNIY